MSARTANIKKIKYERAIKEKRRKGRQVDVANSGKTKGVIRKFERNGSDKSDKQGMNGRCIHIK